MKTAILPGSKQKQATLFLISVIAMMLNTEKGLSQKLEKRQASCYEISFSGNYLQYKVQKEISAADIDSVKSIHISGKTGFGVGVLKNFEVAHGTLIRTGLQVQLHKNTAGYDLYNGNKEFNINTVSCSVPVSFIYLFNNQNKKPVVAKPYPVVGARYTFVSAFQDKQNFYFLSNDIMADIGVGVHLYSKKKHLVALEFLFSKGFLNVKEKNTDDIYNRTVNKLFRQTYMFSINIS
ncbi:MAG: hypothetical protein WAQ28_01190 [Bacteroidia bacterium]|jgi:hypothetical protein